MSNGRWFNKGDRVVMTKAAQRMFAGVRRTTGVVVYQRYKRTVTVLRDGLKCPTRYYSGFWRKEATPSDLAKLLPPSPPLGAAHDWSDDEWAVAQLRLVARHYPKQLTAFALAVARAERERCATEVGRVIGHAHLARTVVRNLPDPDWSVTP